MNFKEMSLRSQKQELWPPTKAGEREQQLIKNDLAKDDTCLLYIFPWWFPG